jgi:signal transduction histidine kinase
MSGVTGRPRVLRVSSRPEGHDMALVSVEDTGSGVDPVSLESIFDAFFTTKQDGMGMGLAICRSIIESHGGTLWATPRQPHGSIFRFTVGLAPIHRPAR